MNVQGLAQSLGCRLVEAIEKGWSGDRKFLLEDGAGERFVLRLSAKQEEQKKRREFERVRQLHAMFRVGEKHFRRLPGALQGSNHDCFGSKIRPAQLGKALRAQRYIPPALVALFQVFLR